MRHKEPYEKRRAMLKSWAIRDSQGPGLRLSLVGIVYGHPSFADRTVVQTSPLLRLDIPNRTAETINTVYLLG